ncbi:MAG: glycoside hydrolase family 25 protein [Bacteroidales bacterium]|nr:glycoside hydrolase family 25 protein [Candidatus Colimorpha pelethequi]
MRWLCSAILSVLLFVLPAPQAAEGIDVSHYQGNVNWKKVAKSGNVKFVYVKATEGASLSDDRYKENVKEARAAGLLVGSYHLYSPRTTAYDQMRNIRSVVRKKDQDLKFVLDIEEKHTRNLYMKRVDKLLELIENEYGAKPIIYTNEHVYRNYFSGPKYKKYQFFIANYRCKPRIEYTLWQYTECGTVDGIKGRVDKIRFHKNSNIDDIKL